MRQLQTGMNFCPTGEKEIPTDGNVFPVGGTVFLFRSHLRVW